MLKLLAMPWKALLKKLPTLLVKLPTLLVKLLTPLKALSKL